MEIKPFLSCQFKSRKGESYRSKVFGQNSPLVQMAIWKPVYNYLLISVVFLLDIIKSIPTILESFKGKAYQMFGDYIALCSRTWPSSMLG